MVSDVFGAKIGPSNNFGPAWMHPWVAGGSDTVFIYRRIFGTNMNMGCLHP